MATITSLTSNRDVDYIQKDFDSIVDAIITFSNVQFGPGTSANRLWTNFNADSFSRNWLEIVAFVGDVFFFYFDVQATQAYLQTATIRSAVRDIAKQFGFEPATASSASGDVVFTFTGTGTLARGFKVSTSSGVPFYLTDQITASVPGEFTGTVLQGEIKTEAFAAKGLQNEEFELEGPNVIVDEAAVNALDRSPILTVNGNTYTKVESFIRHNGTDTPAIVDSLGNVTGGGGRVFQLGERPNGAPFIRFGDGIFGRKLLPGETISITYRTGGGTQGNAAAGTVTTLVDNVSFVSSVNNPSDFSGGTDEQSIEQLRDLIPASLRTLERAVAETDYSDIITANFNEVSTASTEINNEDPGIDLNIYVVPQGSSITTVTSNTLLLNKITDFVDRRKMVTVQFQILDAFGVQVVIELEVFINDTASKSTVKEAITTALLSFFDLNSGSTDKGGIDFAEEILLKDINNIVQAVDGVNRFEIKKLTYRPRIDKQVQGLVTKYNSSEVDTFSNVDELEWITAASGQSTEAAGTVIFSNSTPTGFTYDSSTGTILYNSQVLLDGVAPGDSFRNGPGLFETTEIKTVGDGAGATEVFTVATVADEQGVQEVSTIQTVADVGGSLSGAWFVLYDLAGSVGVWFNVDASSTKPSMGTNRDLEVAISSNDNANTIAGAIQAVLNTDSEFTATVTGIPQKTEITATAKSNITDAQYFFINAANDATKYYVWFDVTGGATDPAVSGRTGVKVDITADTTADDVAESIRAALDALGDFSATRVGSVTTVLNSNNGPATPAQNVNVGGSFSISTIVTGVNADTVTATHNTKLDVFDITDGTVPTNFVLTTTVQGKDPDSLGGTYFDISDDVGPVRVWFDVDNTSTAPSNPGRLIEVDISANDSASDVATALQSKLNADAKYTATVSSNVVTVTHSTVGEKDDPTDGVLSTGFTFNIITQGADAVSIDGSYFVISDVNGGIAFWFDVDDSGTVEPAHGQLRSVEINTVTSGMTDAQVAAEVEKALTSAAPYTAELAEVSLVTTLPDISGSLNNRYFLLSAANDATRYYVWYNVSSTGTDPSIAGFTGIEVNISTNDTANAVAAATQAAINAIPDFTATVVSDDVTITNVAGGKATDTQDSNTATATGFSFTTLKQGATFNVSTASNVITVTATDKASIDDPDAATSGFTITVTQLGVADDTDFPILGVDLPNSKIFIAENQPVNPIPGVDAGGSIRNGSTTFESFKVFKKSLAKATNLSTDSITDNNLDLSVKTGTATALSARVLIDNTQVFIPGEFATSDFFLVDGSGNIWEIEDNTSNTITTSITAVNDAAISNVSNGDYKIVQKLVGSQIVFNGSIFNIQYNSENTIFSIGAQFTQIGTIGDSFSISKEQTAKGKLGLAADLIDFNSSTGEIRLNGSPDLQGISSGDTLIDSSGQTFQLIGIDNRALPIVEYSDSNQSTSLVLTGLGLDSQLSQGFQVTETDTYSVVSVNMKREGNILGNLTARIVLDDGTGLPDVTQLVAVSNSVNVTTVGETVFEKVLFPFTASPTLNSGVQYHLVISGDVAYSAAQRDGIVVFNNTSSVAYTYTSLSGVVEYASPVDLSAVSPGNFFQDNDGTLFKILSVDDSNDQVVLDAGLPVIVGSNGNIIANDNIRLGADNLTPTFTSGEMSRWDGSAWSNSTTGFNQFSTEHDMIFSVEGPKSIKIDSNLTPVLGEGATISTRYYDDENQVSFIIGISNGTVTSASDVNALGKGTVGGLPNTLVDRFIFRTSRVSDDIVNLRLNEIPQLTENDIVLNIFGGVS